MKTREYTFTGFYSSGNPFDWYHDLNKNASFTTSIVVATWSKKPKIGDKVKMVYSGYYGEILEQAFINNEQVFERSAETEKRKQEITDEIYDKLKREKGLV